MQFDDAEAPRDLEDAFYIADAFEERAEGYHEEEVDLQLRSLPEGGALGGAVVRAFE